MDIHFRRVTIIGVGLIGGSLAMVMKKKGLADEIIGAGRRRGNLQKAKKLGVIDGYSLDLQKAAKGADLVVLTAPVGSFEKIAEEIRPALGDGTVVTDVGSVKGRLVGSLERIIPYRVRYVGAHPIAGREKSGIEAASADLFKGTRCILTPTKRTEPGALRMIRALWEKAGAKTISMDPYRHDMIFGAVSHLPHVIAYCLVNTVLDLEEEGQIIKYSAGGFKDFTRVAASHPEMWRDICLLNRDNLIDMVKRFQKTLDNIREAIETGDETALLKEFKRARKVRARLN